MRVLCVIPARYGSSRLPGKPLADIAGAPMVVRVLARAGQATRPDAVLVATDDARIVTAVEAAGGRAELTDPRHASGSARVAEIAARFPADIYVNVQGDEPCLDPAAIDAVVDGLAAHPDWDLASGYHALPGPPLDDPNTVKVVCAHDGRALYFSRCPIPYPRHGGGGCRIHLGLYAYRRDVLLSLSTLPASPLAEAESLEQLAFLQAGLTVGMVAVAAPAGPSVDTPEDLEQVRALYSSGLFEA